MGGRGARARERERSLLTIKKCQKVGKHNALSGHTASGRGERKGEREREKREREPRRKEAQRENKGGDGGGSREGENDSKVVARMG